MDFLLWYSESLSGAGCSQMLNRKFVIKRALVRINKMWNASFLGNMWYWLRFRNASCRSKGPDCRWFQHPLPACYGSRWSARFFFTWKGHSVQVREEISDKLQRRAAWYKMILFSSSRTFPCPVWQWDATPRMGPPCSEVTSSAGDTLSPAGLKTSFLFGVASIQGLTSCTWGAAH